jgi:hypothetical protein
MSEVEAQIMGRLLYTYDPETNIAIGDGEPIRDIAAVWDVEVLSAFLGRDDLRDLVRRSLVHFEQRVVPRAGYAIVAPGGESSSIAHSAFMALALARSDLPDKEQRFTPLADGILRQQREDGSYKIFFEAVPDSGEELYPAEAMLALSRRMWVSTKARSKGSERWSAAPRTSVTTTPTTWWPAWSHKTCSGRSTRHSRFDPIVLAAVGCRGGGYSTAPSGPLRGAGGRYVGVARGAQRRRGEASQPGGDEPRRRKLAAARRNTNQNRGCRLMRTQAQAGAALGVRR